MSRISPAKPSQREEKRVENFVSAVEDRLKFEDDFLRYMLLLM